ncbi:MAG: outer membrane beta-barrel domain-containing protein [Deltaproteobacteria bacterium]|nr:outer membrane beta-barrel domain-containing protein [Deltaproteobacteria bacterium]
MKYVGRIPFVTALVASAITLLGPSWAHAAEKSLPVVDRKLYPMRFNPEFTLQFDYGLADKYTSHQGLRASALFHIWDNVAVEAYGGYLFGSESSIMKTLREKSRSNRETQHNGREPALPGLQQLTYHLGVDGQFAPIYGKLSFVSEFEASFQLYLLGGVAMAGTRTLTDQTLLNKQGAVCQANPVSKGCATFFAGPAKLASIPSFSPGGSDIFGAGEYQLVPWALPVQYGLGMRIHLGYKIGGFDTGKWFALRAEIRNYHWLGINNDWDRNKGPINVMEDPDDEKTCGLGYRVSNAVLEFAGATPCFLNTHSVTLANVGLSFTIPVNSFF